MAFLALGYIKSEYAIDFLGKFLENHECNVSQWISGNYPCSLCQCAVEALQRVPIGQKVQYSLLFAALRHKDGVVRDYSKELLRANMTERTCLKLIDIMLNKKEDSEIREKAIHIMRGDVARFDIVTGNSIGAELKHPNISIGPLIQIALKEEDADLRRSAASALGHCKEKRKEIVERLIEAISEDVDPSVRANAVYGLLYQFSPRATKALIKALDDEDATVRARAAYTLIYTGTKTPDEEEKASRKLLGLFNDRDINVRINVIHAYGRIRRNPNNEELRHLIHLLKDSSNSVRCEVAEALGVLKARNALDALKSMVEEEKYIFPWAKAIWAIIQIEPDFIETIKENGWEYSYITLLSSNDEDEREMAAKVLRDIGTEISLPYLKAIYED